MLSLLPEKMNKLLRHPLSYTLLWALLLGVAWPPLPLNFLLLAAWIPFLLMEKKMQEQRTKARTFWLYSLLGLFVWNLVTTWWVSLASFGGAIAMLVANSLLMSLPLLAFYYTRRIVPKTGYSSLVVYWMAFEYFHFNWDAAYPWLSLGNGLAALPQLIQWYEYTGVSGGTFWILLCNIFIFNAFTNKSSKLVATAVVLVPAFFSVYRYFTFKDTGKEAEVVIVQPSVDPYSEKFEVAPEQLSQKMFELASKVTTPQTALVLLPETALTHSTEVRYFDSEEKVHLLEKLFDSFPNIGILTGAETHEFYYADGKPTPTARNHSEGIYYDMYNTAVMMKHQQASVFYHKAKLVPGVEKMPFPALMGFLESLIVNLDGTTGTLGSSPNAVVFRANDSIVAAPLICYESVFGEYVTDFVKNGATLIAIITNDAWWGKTPGYRQHLLYGALRAIENRRWIARSANTGTSCIINSRGDILHATDWYDPTAFKANVRLNTELTAFALYGDVAGKSAVFVTVLLLLSTLVKSKTKKFA